MKAPVIDQNWERTVESHLNSMERQWSALEKLSPLAPEFDFAEAAYIGLCQHFVDYMETHFGSPMGFASFLKAETQILFPQGSNADNFLDKFNWYADRQDVVAEAESLMQIYRHSYGAIQSMFQFLELSADKTLRAEDFKFAF